MCVRHPRRLLLRLQDRQRGIAPIGKAPSHVRSGEVVDRNLPPLDDRCAERQFGIERPLGNVRLRLPRRLSVSRRSPKLVANDPVDARALTYSIGYIGIKRLGTAQFLSH